MDVSYPRGAEWRKWDLHIHTPASFHWNGARFPNQDPKSPDNAGLIDEMIEALNTAEPAVFALMDYWTFDGWIALQHRLSQPDSPTLTKTVFPGIELRLVAPMQGRLNAHVLFSNKINEQHLNDFKSALSVARINRPLSNMALIDCARDVGVDLLKTKGYEKEAVDSDDKVALQAGSKIAEITCESYKEAIRNVPNEMAIGFMPFNTNDGLAEVKWEEHYAYTLGLFDCSPIFETRCQNTWAAFSGIATEGNKDWFKDFQNALDNTPRLAVSGSDAHQFRGVAGDNNRRGYGDYPSGKTTWIKADPTFEGLKQAIEEPAKRSFLGEIPPKKKRYNENKSIFLDTLHITKEASSACLDNWLEGVELPLNPDLIAVIGNKGSGKSALADIIALLGNSKQSQHFSFLLKNRFRGRDGTPAKHFIASAKWVDGEEYSKNLNDDPAIEEVELVKYIPQGHFEELCNMHVSGESNAFENELRSVIFSHVDETIRQDASNFDNLIEQQESSLMDQVDDLRGDLKKLNRTISRFERDLQPEKRKAIEEQILQAKRLLDEHEKIEPPKVEEPSGELSDEQKSASEELDKIAEETNKIDEQRKTTKEELLSLSSKRQACKNIREQLVLVKKAHQDFKKEVEEDATLVGLELSNIISVQIKEELISKIEEEIFEKEKELRASIQDLETKREELVSNQSGLSKKLNEPQQAYQKYLEDMKAWEDKKSQIIGSSEIPSTLRGLEHQLKQIEELPKLREEMQQQRLELTGQIFGLLNDQRKGREDLFTPVQELIQNNELIRDGYKLQFIAELICTSDYVGSHLFELVKQNSGEFRGEPESFSVLQSLLDKYDLNVREELLSFVTELHDKLESAAAGESGISSILRKDRESNDVYDFIFSLTYLKPQYTLLFQDAHISQLSPGQRGALLLIFYLLVDKGDTPIILDQPEENLDNETIVGLLVPVLVEAKKSRQIIMVTHNPNLAVVCDAEQIIHCDFDRRNNYKITYTPGSIECKLTNNKVVDVLEGTMPAFNNRKTKYISR